MKSFQVILFLFLLVFSVSSPNFTFAKTESKPQAGNQFIDKENGFSIFFPKDWKMKENIQGTAVMGFSAKEGEDDSFLENINVVVSKPNLEGYDVQKYFQVNLGPLAELESFKELERGEMVIEGKKAIWIIFTHHSSNKDAKAIQYYLVRGSRGYVITGTALSGTFAKYKPQFDQIAKTFKSL